MATPTPDQHIVAEVLRTNMELQNKLQKLEQAVDHFKECIHTLPSNLFLKPMDDNNWSPRDVTAHLIGWNRYTIEGCQEILHGRTPFYFSDASNDYSNVNFESVSKYTSNSKLELFEELDESLRELSAYLTSLDSSKWEADYGVKHGRWIITIANTVEVLCKDYNAHRQEIEQWASKIMGVN